MVIMAEIESKHFLVGLKHLVAKKKKIFFSYLSFLLLIKVSLNMKNIFSNNNYYIFKPFEVPGLW